MTTESMDVSAKVTWQTNRRKADDVAKAEPLCQGEQFGTELGAADNKLRTCGIPTYDDEQ